MGDGHSLDAALASLTDKERETLRLLGQGHDIKSVAAELGLSPHTIAERLRDARRKLGVTSSREAARRLRLAEGAGAASPATPMKSGDRLLRDAVRGDLAADDPQPVTAPLRRWIAGAGAIVMLTIAIAAAAFLAQPADHPPGTAPSADGSATSVIEGAPAVAARAFLARLDAYDWAGSYALTGGQFRRLNTEAAWASASESARRPLGAMVSRTLTRDTDVPAPPAGYRMLTFRTRFANRATDATETVTLELDGGAWRVVGVTIA